MRKIYCFVFLLFSVVPIHAQDGVEYRMEIGAGLSALTYEGDFNGNLFKSPQPMGMVLARYHLNPMMDVRFSVGYGHLKGNSGDVETYYPQESDAMEKAYYDFNRQLLDIAIAYEYNIFPYGTGRDVRGTRRFTPYIYIGLGSSYASGSDSPSVVTAHVPLGIGMKFKFGERVNIGIDWGIRFSLSDKLDGVADPYGIKSSGLFKNTDCYSGLGLSCTYSFSAKCRTCNKDD